MSTRKRSTVWLHFDEVEGNKGKCKYCFLRLSCAGGSTGNLTRHIKTKHPSVPLGLERSKTYSNKSTSQTQAANALPRTSLVGEPMGDPDDPSQMEVDLITNGESGVADQLDKQQTQLITSDVQKQHHKSSKPKKNQSSLSTYIDSVKPVSMQKAKNIDKQLLKMIVKEYHPFSIVEDTEFKNLIKELCPGYSLPTRKTVTNSLLPMYYKSAVEELKQELSPTNIRSVALTTDCWTSLINESFIAITAHYIDEKFEMHSKLLECESFIGSHIAENLAAAHQSTAQKWVLTNYVTAITTDNASNIVLAVKNTSWRHVRCFAHSVNLVTQKGLEHLNPTLSTVKSLVEHFKRSSTDLAKLQEIQEQMGLPKQKLKQDVSTRWNSTFDMLVRVHKNKEPILSATAILQLGEKFCISREEWTAIHQAIKVLSVFNAVTIEISGEKMATLSKTIVLARVMVKHINKSLLEPDLCKNVREMCYTLKDELSTRFNNLEGSDLHSQALILDPRFKNDGFADKAKYQQAYDKLTRMAAAIKLPDDEAADNSRSPEPQTKKRKRDEFFVDLYEEYRKEKPQTEQPTAAALVELQSYINDETLAHDKDPLKYWKLNQHRFPRLCRLAQKRLCIPATSVPCERIFSKAGYTLSERRSRLQSGKLRQILFLNHNWI